MNVEAIATGMGEFLRENLDAIILWLSIMGAASFFVALYIAGYTYDIYKQQQRRYLQEDQDSIRADMTAYVFEDKETVGFSFRNTTTQDKNHYYKIRIYNQGKAMARNVRLELNAKSWESISKVEDLFPREFIQPQETFRLPPLLYLGESEEERVVIRWDDSLSSDNEKSVDLDILKATRT